MFFPHNVEGEGTEREMLLQKLKRILFISKAWTIALTAVPKFSFCTNTSSGTDPKSQKKMYVSACREGITSE